MQAVRSLCKYVFFVFCLLCKSDKYSLQPYAAFAWSEAPLSTWMFSSVAYALKVRILPDLCHGTHVMPEPQSGNFSASASAKCLQPVDARHEWVLLSHL